MKPGYSRRPFVKKEALHKINELITAANVRVVGEHMPVDVYPTAKALEVAYELGMDLVEISPQADPPVCKIVDYKKFLYEQKKKQKEQFGVERKSSVAAADFLRKYAKKKKK